MAALQFAVVTTTIIISKAGGADRTFSAPRRGLTQINQGLGTHHKVMGRRQGLEVRPLLALLRVWTLGMRRQGRATVARLHHLNGDMLKAMVEALEVDMVDRVTGMGEVETMDTIKGQGMIGDIVGTDNLIGVTASEHFRRNDDFLLV